MGILLHQLVKQWGDRLRSRPRVSALICVAGSVLVSAVYFGTFHPEGWVLVFGPLLLSAGTMAVLLGGLHWKAMESQWLSRLAAPGKYCYGNYLLHAVILYFLHAWLIRMHTAAAFLFFVLVSTLVAAASYKFFEMPCDRWIRSRYEGKSS